MKALSPADVKPRLTRGEEIAFVDVREAGQYGEGHPFFAINIPYSRFELRVERLIPRKDAPVILMDDGDAVSEKAARRLEALGYTDIAILAGGAPAWAKAGYTLYQGVNLPSKTFGELVEHAADTPRVTADELHAMKERGESFILLDGRTPHEYARMTIPGSRSCPNAELGHRLPAMLSDPETPVVINCAGRTRSIIGAQSLINLAIENPVFALENGTQGWTLAGHQLDRMNSPQAVEKLSEEQLAMSRERGKALAEKFAVPIIDLATLERWQRDEGRTLYVLDVRTVEEFEAGRLPGAVHAPGGQLVQATDQWVAVRGARIVLTDDTGLRAAQSAYWLRQMGHDVHVLDEDVSALESAETGPDKPPAITPTLQTCDAGSLAEGAVVLDLRPSMQFRKGHLEGARWAIRPRLAAIEIPADTEIVLIADKPGVAELAAIDLREAGHSRLSMLGGEPAGAVETPADPPDEACIDYLFFVHDRHDGNMDAARGYLEWEVALIGQLDEQERGVFKPQA